MRRLALLLTTTLGLVGCVDREPPPRVLAGVGHMGFLNAMRLAIADELAAGPIPGLDTVLVEAVSNRAAPEVETAGRLVDLPGLVAVVGHANSQASLATAPIYNRARVIQLAPTSTAPSFSQAGPYSFRLVPPDSVQGTALAREAMRRFEARGRLRIAIAYVNDDYGRGLRAATVAALDTARVRLVGEFPHNEGDVQEPDPEGLVAALAEVRPDMILWLGRVPVLNVVLPVLRRALGGVPILTGDAAYWAALMDDRISEWDGVEYLDFVDMEADPALQSFRERMWERFETGAAGPEALIYDATRVLLAALRSGADTGDDARRYLASLGSDRPPHPGLTGPIAFDSLGDIAERSYVLRRIEPRITPE